uniref:Uncharacterized protein n=2 Tax=Octopus bimaculoides TaxID=37653 RepID=A0A0L8HPY2_OCTBM
MKANSFKGNQKLFIDPAKLLPLSRFLTPPRGGGRGNYKLFSLYFRIFFYRSKEVLLV